jgi:2-polyprenyl-3-methyl-5-hydroxy-6-metoxy-1,4-benzoquinol methylase
MTWSGSTMTGKSPQNIYDDERFFEGYSQLERFGPGWNNAMEHPSFMSLLPDVAGLRVVDLGCGVGQLAYHLAEAGAAEVVGVDLSERMLELAQADRPHPRVRYQRAALEEIEFPPDSVNLVVSSLAFHYVEDYAGLVRRIAGWLTSNGLLVYSTEHPVYTARDPADGWVLDAEANRQHWALNNYAEEGLREYRWYVERVRKYHRTMATLLNGLIDAGLNIDRVLEPVPDAATLQRHPDYIDERRRPPFLLLRARRA